MRAEGITVPPIPVVFTECDNDEDARRKIMALASTYGEVNKAFLQEFSKMAGVELDALPMKYTFPDLDIKAFVAGIQNAADNRDGEEAPLTIPIKAITKRGQAWQLGEHRIMCGDSTDADHVKLLMDRPADMVMTSPPYNVGIKYRGFKDELTEKQYLDFLGDILKNCLNSMAKGRCIVWNVGISPKTFHVEQARLIRDTGFQFYRQVIWYKPGVPKPIFHNSNKVRKYLPNYQHEMIYIASKGAPEFGIDTKMPDEAANDVWRVSQSQSNADFTKAPADKKSGLDQVHHPAMFPVKLPLLAMECLTAKGETIFDPFGGAGSTLIAAERGARVARLMEQDPIYVDVTVARWERETGKKAKLVDLKGPTIGFGRDN